MALQVERALLQVPRGRVTTYGDIARALGDVRASRAVGELLAGAAPEGGLPGHRVVMADGSLGAFARGGIEAKARLLASEGVPLRGLRVEALGAVAVRELKVEPIFRRLAGRQRRLAAAVRTARMEKPPKVAIGVDAAYAKAGAFGAAVAVDLNTNEPFASAVARFEPPVPYVPGYLAFRELPGITAAVRKLPAEARRRAVLVVDGQGILHPRRCGVASMAGLALGMPALGVAKGKLVGSVARKARTLGAFEARAVSMEGEVRGYELQAPPHRERLYASPGTGISVPQAASLAATLTEPGAESPLPVLLADDLSRRARAEPQAHVQEAGARASAVRVRFNSK